MAISMTSPGAKFADGEEAWQAYQEINRVVTGRYKLSVDGATVYYPSVSRALQLLGQAVRWQYNLDEATHPVPIRWNFTFPRERQLPPLSTFEEMLRARVVIWEYLIPAMQAGHDTWTRERPAGYRAQESIEEELGTSFYRVRTIVDTTFEHASGLYERIRGLVDREIRRLEPDKKSRKKVAEVRGAMTRLFQALVYKYDVRRDDVAPLSRQEQWIVTDINLYTVHTLLDAEIGKRSVRQALNLSTRNLFSMLFGLQEAMWGKATALENVERDLMHD